MSEGICKETVISVVGPTASGKTALAGRLIEKWLAAGEGVVMISLDARQIYRGLGILSGADREELPVSENLQIYNLLEREIDEEFSLGVLIGEMKEVVEEARREGKRVILVGGTLMYHQRLLAENDLTSVPPNDNLRFAAENMSVAEIQEWLQKVAGADFAALNDSDKQNPRRLVRKLEIALYHKIQAEEVEMESSQQLAGCEDHLEKEPSPPLPHAYLITEYQLDEVLEKIAVRVQQRFIGGAVEEVAAKLKSFSEIIYNKNWLSRMPLGFLEIAQFIAAEISEAECLETWVRREQQYAKRQETYLKKLRQQKVGEIVTLNEFLDI